MESLLSAHHRFIRMRSKPITFYNTQYFRQRLKPRQKYCEIVKTAKINTKESEGKFSRRPLLLATPVIKYQENFQFNLFLANSVAGALQWLLKHFQEVIWFFSPSRSVFLFSRHHFSLSCSFSLSLQNQISAFLWVTRIRRHCSGVCSNSCTSAFSLFKDSEWNWGSG